jgi:branched-chain amino acid transport system substrate-binding protein
MHRRFSGGGTALLLAGALSLSLVAASATPAGAAIKTQSPIVIGYISNLTGIASSTFTDGAGGAQAIIDQQNAAGGIDGHPLKLIVKDDTSSLTLDATDAQELVSDGATVVIDYSAFAFTGAPFLQKAGIPVVGSGFDGPEWLEAPYTNMFTWQEPTSSVNGTDYTYGFYGQFLKDLGVKTFGGLGYGISPSSTNSVYEAEASATKSGIKICYTNNTVPFGSTDFTADVLAIKSSNCGAVAGSFVAASDLALSNALKQAGLSSVKGLYFTGYDQAATTPNAAPEFDGSYVRASVNFNPPNAPASALLKTLKKYDTSYSCGVPDFGLLGSAVSAQLAIYGLKLAGSNPTSASFIKAMHKVTSWNDNGLLPTSFGFQHAGSTKLFPKSVCAYFEQLHGTKWTAFTGKPICGKLISLPAPAS